MEESEPIVLWTLSELISENWEKGQFKIDLNYDFILMIQAISNNGEVGQIAIDDFSLSNEEGCPTLPPRADPATTTTATPTPEPTEPPGRKY